MVNQNELTLEQRVKILEDWRKETLQEDIPERVETLEQIIDDVSCVLEAVTLKANKKEALGL